MCKLFLEIWNGIAEKNGWLFYKIFSKETIYNILYIGTLIQKNIPKIMYIKLLIWFLNLVK